MLLELVLLVLGVLCVLQPTALLLSLLGADQLRLLLLLLLLLFLPCSSSMQAATTAFTTIFQDRR